MIKDMKRLENKKKRFTGADGSCLEVFALRLKVSPVLLTIGTKVQQVHRACRGQVGRQIESLMHVLWTKDLLYLLGVSGRGSNRAEKGWNGLLRVTDPPDTQLSRLISNSRTFWSGKLWKMCSSTTPNEVTPLEPDFPTSTSCT